MNRYLTSRNARQLAILGSVLFCWLALSSVHGPVVATHPPSNNQASNNQASNNQASNNQAKVQANTAREYVCPPCSCDSCGTVFKRPGKCSDCGMTLVDKNKVINVAIVLWNGVELLDFAGPGEVFAAAHSDDGRSFRVFTVSKTTSPVVSQGFLKVNPTYSIDDCPDVDVIVLPGGGIDHVTSDEQFMTWIKNTIEKSQIALSVCTGAFVLAEHGYLDEQDATTWHGAIERLQGKYPKVRVLADKRFIDNGKIITSAGVSAGIDSSLHVVARLLGKQSAVNTARYMEYHWQFADDEPAMASGAPDDN